MYLFTHSLSHKHLFVLTWLQSLMHLADRPLYLWQNLAHVSGLSAVYRAWEQTLPHPVLFPGRLAVVRSCLVSCLCPQRSGSCRWAGRQTDRKTAGVHLPACSGPFASPPRPPGIPDGIHQIPRCPLCKAVLLMCPSQWSGPQQKGEGARPGPLPPVPLHIPVTLSCLWSQRSQ